MISNVDLKAISVLDLEPIKMKLMHKPSGEGWSAEKANAVELEYRRFLYLMKAFPIEQTAPLVDVDTFWHYHILDTMKYALDCDQVFGYFLHHYPYVGMLTEDSEQERQAGGDRMQELYEQTFGDSYDQAARAIARAGSYPATSAAYCAAVGKQAAYCAALGKQTAYCATADQEVAYCAAINNTAYCAAITNGHTNCLSHQYTRRALATN